MSNELKSINQIKTMGDLAKMMNDIYKSGGQADFMRFIFDYIDYCGDVHTAVSGIEFVLSNNMVDYELTILYEVEGWGFKQLSNEQILEKANYDLNYYEDKIRRNQKIKEEIEKFIKEKQ